MTGTSRFQPSQPWEFAIEVIAAWTEAYGFLAQLLMGREQELYDQRAQAPGGWLGWREFVVDRVVPESEVITSFHL